MHWFFHLLKRKNKLVIWVGYLLQTPLINGKFLDSTEKNITEQLDWEQIIKPTYRQRKKAAEKEECSGI